MAIKPRYRGISAYGGFLPPAKFSPKLFLDQFPPTVTAPCIALLWDPDNWGTSMELANQFSAKFSDRPHLIEIHATNETARVRANGGHAASYYPSWFPQWDDNAYNRALVKPDAAMQKAVNKLVGELRSRFEPLIKANPTFCKVVLSTGLETNNLWTDAEYKLSALMHKAWPDVELVRNSGQGPGPNCTYLEQHNPGATFNDWENGIVNTDGYAFSCADGLTPNGLREENFRIMMSDVFYDIFAFFIWIPTQQGIILDTLTAGDPIDRTYQFTTEMKAAVQRLLAGVGAPTQPAPTTPEPVPTMKTWIVQVPGVFYVPYEVQAKTAENAANKVAAALASNTAVPAGEAVFDTVYGNQTDWRIDEKA